MHWTSILGLALVTIGGILSFIGTTISSDKSQKELENKISAKDSTIESINASNKELLELNKETSQTNNMLISQNGEMIESNIRLSGQNEGMLAKIEEYQKSIHERDKRIQELEQAVKKAGKGISSNINFDGSYSYTDGSSMSVSSGTPESKIFAKINQLSKDKKWGELITLCDEYILSSPKWYTAYIYKAIALLNINLRANREDAIKLLEYVEQNNVEDPQFLVPVADLYFQMGQEEKAKAIMQSIPSAALSAYRIKTQRHTPNKGSKKK